MISDLIKVVRFNFENFVMSSGFKRSEGMSISSITLTAPHYNYH